MEKLALQEIIEAIDAEVIKSPFKSEFTEVGTDTRKIQQESIFIALKGENFNGNKYIKNAEVNGASLCIIDQLFLEDKELEIFKSGILKVKDTKKALMNLAAYYLKKLNIRVVGITGSTGKTSTKDLTAAAISGKYKVFKTKGNFNNEIGLPLTVLSMDKSYDVAVLEMGMSDFNEIHNLASIARPDIALITNIGVSHIENLKTRENILKAKMEITDFFSKGNTLIINSENDLLNSIEDNKEYSLIKIGFNSKEKELNYLAEDIIINEECIKFNIKVNNHERKEDFKINVPGIHNVLNAQLAIAASRELGLSFDEIRRGFKNIESTSMRLQVINNKDAKIINDSYNASPDSMKAAIEYLKTLNGKRRIAILGTMKELGEESYNLHKDVAIFAKENNIDELFCIGEFSKAYKEGFGEGCIEFESKEKLSDYYNDIRLYGDLVLVKASRSMQFENIVNYIDKLHN
ncbi:UDP-N-acetylmuramoyl-tripeptide--D-alanyl-D-alanine ligase [Hathewaya histolytica]|uniref:UDP-N-acetylmuramoyl-tripeptide--D-alanyl-D- alanine ligase n=1 Tax=Hathewaya histolytica TaxID=1498 RepID=UPI003B684340